MDMRKAKEFVKTHKKEIAIAALVTAGAGVVYVITRKKPEFMEKHFKAIVSSSKDIDVPEIEVGEITDLWTENGYTNMIVNDVKVGELGKFAEEMCKIEGITNDSVISAVIGTADKIVES